MFHIITPLRRKSLQKPSKPPAFAPKIRKRCPQNNAENRNSPLIHPVIVGKIATVFARVATPRSNLSTISSPHPLMPATFRCATPATFRISAQTTVQTTFPPTITIATDNKTDLFLHKNRSHLAKQHPQQHCCPRIAAPRILLSTPPHLNKKSAPISKHNQRATGKCITK